MAGLENILNKIIKDAEEKAQLIIKEAEEKEKTIIENREEEGRFLANKIGEIAEREREDILKRSKSSEELKARDKILSEKNRIIDEVLEKVVSELENLSEDDFVKFLKNNLRDENLKGGTIDIPPKYRVAVEKADLGFKISDKDLKRGFVLNKDNLIYNGDFRSLVKSEREDLEKFLAEKLFS
ncbi:V-type ATP synthase subunit E [Peptoniphilus vaginalis]|uniref:V-type ATP synthase subunit E n=1 Tax=Peptoniphilus vaginalis TaxID=1756987 RepID=UPI0023F67ACF|nr:V-type ATP synthase subunit E [Peptoniphilus vaginalis]